MHANPNKNPASEQPLPRVLGIILLVCVHQHQPLITADRHFATGKFFTHTKWGDQRRKQHIQKKEHRLRIVPVHTRGTEEGASDGMVIAPVCLDIPREGWVYGYARGAYPLQNNTLQALSIVRSCTGYALLNL